MGYKSFKRDVYTVTAILGKTAEAEGESTFGPDAYLPKMIKDEALVEIATGPKVLGPLGEKLVPPESIEQLRRRLKIKYDTRQKLFYLNAKAPTEKIALALVNQWSKDIIEATKEVMRTFAEETADSLKKDLKRLDTDMAPLNEQLRKLSEQEQMIDEVARFTALHAEIETLEAELREIEKSEKTFQSRYRTVVDTLMQSHPLRKQYAKALQDRDQIATEYTEEADQYKKQQGIVNALKARVDKELVYPYNEEEIMKCEEPTLLQNYINLKEEQFKHEEGIFQIKSALSEKRAQLDRLPAVANEFKKLRRTLNTLVESQNAFQSQMDVASYYAGQYTPGYLYSFQDAVLGLGDLSTGKYKMLATAVLVSAIGLALAFLFGLFWEYRRPEMRTMLQGAITTRAMPKFWLTQSDDVEDEANIREFWLTALSKGEGEGRRILFPIVANLKSEFIFWKSLLQSIKRDNALVLFIDVAQEPVPDSFLKANLLPFNPPAHPPGKASSFLQAGGVGSDDLWQKQSLSEGTSGGPAVGPLTPRPVVAMPDQPQTTALGDMLLPEDQPLIPYQSDVTQSARYVSAADYSTEQLSRLLKDLPPHYYVICRWAIGPTSSLAAIAKNFDQHYLLNTPQNSAKKVAASQSRIFRRILDQPDGILFLNEPSKGRIDRLVNWAQSLYFKWRDDSLRPKRSKKDSEESQEEDLL